MTERFRFTFTVTDRGECYHATEPGTETDVVGRGETPAEAIRNYAEVWCDE